MAFDVITGVKGSLTLANTLGAAITAAMPEFSPLSLAQGVSSQQVDMAYAGTLSFTSGSTTNFDLVGATYKDVFGRDLAFAKVKAIYIKNKSTTLAATLTVGNHATAAFVGPFGAAANTLTIPAGGAVMLTAPDAGWAVTATTADLIKLLASAHAFDVDLVILGTSS